jgi:phage pi2 protein 07
MMNREAVISVQQLNVNLSIPVPSDQVLISKVELEELHQESLSGVYWNMSDLKKQVNKSDKWIKENILYPTSFRSKLDAKNGGPVYYPESQGQTWSFQAKKMAKFLDDNFNIIFGR